MVVASIEQRHGRELLDIFIQKYGRESIDNFMLERLDCIAISLANKSPITGYGILSAYRDDLGYLFDAETCYFHFKRLREEKGCLEVVNGDEMNGKESESNRKNKHPIKCKATEFGKHYLSLRKNMDDCLWNGDISEYIKMIKNIDEREGWVAEEHLNQNLKWVILKLTLIEKCVWGYSVREKFGKKSIRSYGSRKMHRNRLYHRVHPQKLYDLLGDLEDDDCLQLVGNGSETVKGREPKKYSITKRGEELLHLNQDMREKLWNTILTAELNPILSQH